MFSFYPWELFDADRRAPGLVRVTAGLQSCVVVFVEIRAGHNPPDDSISDCLFYFF